MIKIVLGILQALAKVFFVLMSLSVVILLCLAWFKFSQEGGKLPLDALDLNILVADKALSEGAIESLKASLNESTFTATLVLTGFTIFMLFLVFPFYLVKQFLLNLTPEKWFVEENTARLRYLAFYFIGLALLKAAGYFAGLYLPGATSVKLSVEPGSFLLGLGILLLSYMYQQGVRLRQETDMTV